MYIFSLRVDMGNMPPWSKSGKMKCPFLWNSSVMLHPLSCLIKMERTFLYVCPILPFIRIGIDCAFPLSLDNEMSFIFIYGLHKSVSLAAFHAPVPRCCVGISHPARQLNQKLVEKKLSLQNSFKPKIYIIISISGPIYLRDGVSKASSGASNFPG